MEGISSTTTSVRVPFSMETPKTGDSVKGQIKDKAAATEHQKAKSLQFQLDGENLGPALTSGASTRIASALITVNVVGRK